MGREQKALLFVVIWKQIDTKVWSKHQDFFLFLKVGGTLIRVGALNRDHTVSEIIMENNIQIISFIDLAENSMFEQSI